jgi:hypothetical protein
VVYHQRAESRSFPKVELVLNTGDSGQVLVNAGGFVKFLADWYLLIGQFFIDLEF